jgi:hypothetical protein
MNARGLRHDEACGGNAQDCPRPISDCFRMGQVCLVLHTLSVTGCPEDVPTPEWPLRMAQDRLVLPGHWVTRVQGGLRMAQDGCMMTLGVHNCVSWSGQTKHVQDSWPKVDSRWHQDVTGACPLTRAVCHACPGRFQDCLRRAEHTPHIGQDAFRSNVITAKSFAQFPGISSAVGAVPMGANISDLLIRGCRVARVGSAEHGAVRQWLSYVLRRVRPAWH